MSSGFLLPDPSGLKGVLGMLYGEDLSIADAASPPGDGALCTVYVSDDGAPVAAALCDIAFGAYAGAALSMIPAGGAQDAAASGDLSSGMIENLHEVMNICSRLFMGENTPHLKLERLYKSGEAWPAPVQEMVGAGTGPSFRVDIPRYGAGVLSLVTAA